MAERAGGTVSNQWAVTSRQWVDGEFFWKGCLISLPFGGRADRV